MASYPIQNELVFHQDSREKHLLWHLEDGKGSLEILPINDQPPKVSNPRPPDVIEPKWQPSEPVYHFKWD
jgi:hypothetical protein